MDRFFCNEESIEKKKEAEFKEILNELVKKGSMNLLEYSYLTDYLTDGGTLVNSSWFIDIVNKQNSEKLCRIIKSCFPNLYKKPKGENKIKSKLTKLADEIVANKKQHIEFTKDQKKAINSLFDFFPNFKLKAYGLYGYAGTGKTTTIVEVLSFLLTKKIIKTVAFTAPTNKAVNVIKSKFRNYLKEIYQIYFSNELPSQFSFDDTIEKLYEVGVRIDFITIHKLLKFEMDYGANGTVSFVKTNAGSLISNYEIVIIDECSMISIDLAEHIFNELRTSVQKGSDNFKKTPKVIFLGDPAQLPPVGEDLSVIFAKSKKDLTFDEYKKILNQIKKNASASGIEPDEPDESTTTDAFFRELKKDASKSKYDALLDDIIAMPNMTLKKVMRSKLDEVTNMCYEIRIWTLGEVKAPSLSKHIKGGVKAYKHKQGSHKTKSDWFSKCLEQYKSGQNCNIILTWTNQQANEYNKSIRNALFKSDKIGRFMEGDILMLSEFYNMDDGQITYVGEETTEKKFYTSEQIKIIKIEQSVKSILNFSTELNRKASKLQNSQHYETKYKQCIDTINKSTKRSYLCWKLCVSKIGDSNIEAKQEYNTIYVIHEKDEKRYANEKLYISSEIKKLGNILMAKYREKANTIETNIIKPLWKDFHKNMIEPFANVSYGYAITCHKGQGSNFYNAFVDVDDILKNTKDSESRHCLYTAVTRTSNELFLLV